MAKTVQIGKRVVTFIDGQNLYHTARTIFDITHPDYDVLKLSNAVLGFLPKGCFLSAARFYTGMPDPNIQSHWGNFWIKKKRAIIRQGVRAITRPLHYRDHKTEEDDGSVSTEKIPVEKGIDIRIALDLVSLYLNNSYDRAIIFSQDQDLAVAVEEVKMLVRKLRRPVRIYSAYPCSGIAENKRGINGTDWIKIDQQLYDSCIDPTDYR